jgi:hypothetical protein
MPRVRADAALTACGWLVARGRDADPRAFAFGFGEAGAGAGRNTAVPEEGGVTEAQVAMRCVEIARSIALEHERVQRDFDGITTHFKSTSETAHGIADRIMAEFGLTAESRVAGDTAAQDASTEAR